MTHCGTPAWIAPEVLQGSSLSVQADIYSFGIIMWEIATRRLPFEGENFTNVAFNVIGGKRPQVPLTLPDAFAGFMRSCWHQKPGKRPSAEELCCTIEGWSDTSLSEEFDVSPFRV